MQPKLQSKRISCNGSVNKVSYRKQIARQHLCLYRMVHQSATLSSDVNKTFLSRPRVDQDFTRTTEQVTISWSQNEQNSIHTTRIAVYETRICAAEMAVRYAALCVIVIR